MYESTTEIRVRYGETDQMGYVYYGFYAWYYEVGRVEALRQLGLTYKSMEEDGVLLPVVSMRARYLRPARYDDLLTVRTTIPRLPQNSFITFHSEITNQDGELVNAGDVRLVFVDKTYRKKCAPPDVLIDKLSPYFE